MSGVTKLAPLGDSRPAADLTTNPPHMPDVGGTSGAAVLTPLRASNSAPALQPTDDAAWRAHIPGVAIPVPRAEARGRVVDSGDDLLSVLRSIWQSTESIEATIDKAVACAAKFVRCERHSMFLVDASTSELVLSTSEDAQGVRIPMSRGFAGHAARTGEALNIVDAYADPRFDRSVDMRTGFHTNNLLCVPIHDSDGAVVAVLQAVNRLSDSGVHTGFTPRDISVLNAMGDSIGVAIRKAQMHHRVLKEKRNVEALFDLMKAVHADEGATLNLRALTDVILKTAKHLLMADNVKLFLISPMRDELYLAPSNSSESILSTKRFKIGEEGGIPGHVADKGVCIAVSRLSTTVKDDMLLSALIDKMPADAHSVVCMPVTTNPHKYCEKVDRSDIEAVIFASRSRLGASTRRSSLDKIDEDAAASATTATSSSTAAHTPSAGSREPKRMVTVTAARRLAQPFSKDDQKALLAFCFEVARALKMHAVETAFESLMSEEHVDLRQHALDLSFLALYTDASTVKTRPAETKAYVTGGGGGKGGGRDDEGDEDASHVVTTRTSMLIAPERARDRDADQKKRDGISQKNSSQGLSTHVKDVEIDPRCLDVDFEVFNKPRSELAMHVPVMLEDFGVISTLQVDRQALSSFLGGVLEGYATVDNPFHNFYHGWDVFRTSYFFLRPPGMNGAGGSIGGGMKSAGNAGALLDKLTIFSALIAALCHDIAHTGKNNQFEVNSGSPLAMMHNDDAVLERHHAQTTLSLLKLPENEGVLQQLSSEETRRFRKIVITVILSTDMSQHFKIVENCEKRMLDDAPFDKANLDDRLFVSTCVVHCADLGGQTAPWNIAAKWGEMVIQEFSAQSGAEEELGLPKSPFMVGLDDEYTRTRLQGNFITYVGLCWSEVYIGTGVCCCRVLMFLLTLLLSFSHKRSSIIHRFVVFPLWEPMCKMFPGMGNHAQQLLENRNRYVADMERLAPPPMEEDEGTEKNK
jgi:hypothetical protein